LPIIEEKEHLEKTVKIYLSKFEGKDDWEEKRNLYAALIVTLKMVTNNGGVLKRMRLPSGDAIATFANGRTREEMIRRGGLIVNYNANKLTVP